MKQRTAQETDPLELLLDTICNVFGGIILMAILVAIQTQNTADSMAHDRAQVERDVACRKLEMELRTIQEKMQELKDLKAELTRQLQGRATPELAALIEKEQAYAERLSKAQDYLNKIDQQATEFRKSATADVGGLGLIDQKLEAARKRLQDARGDIAQLEKTRRKVRLPHRRGRAVGQAMYMVIKDGNIHYATCANPWGKGRQRAGDCIVESFSDDSARIRPAEGAGRRALSAEKLDPQIAGKLRAVKQIYGVVVLFVYPDTKSYAAFQACKDAALEDGYQYVACPVIPEDGWFTVVPTEYHVPE